MISVAAAVRKAAPPQAAEGAPAMVQRTAYRADIDGLRALAVVAVILSHSGIETFRGGFIGVDIFFVISGYLIYRDLVGRLRDGRFSLLDFYARRMRRTLPALYLVAAVTLIVASFALMPGDLAALARSLIAVVVLVPNVFFLTQTGYFGGDALMKPLLHTWSLGVEEQFYLLAPALPLALRGLSSAWRKAAVALLLVAGLAVCMALRQISPDAAFYLMPARIFEFLVGALIVEGAYPRVHRQRVAEAVTASALLAIVVSILVFRGSVPHPGFVTLVPCLATAAIIHVGADWQTRAGTWLGWRPVAFVGLISYSLYLWHWPILVLAREFGLPQQRYPLLATEAVALFCISVLSWRYVELPFRRPGSFWRDRASVLVPAGAASLVASSLLIALFHGFPDRFPASVAKVAGYYAYRDQKPFREGRCFITSKYSPRDFDRATCLDMSASKPNVLLLGDSHAAHLWTGLRNTWPEANFLQVTASGCKPVIGTLGASRCMSLMREMFEGFIPAHHLDGVVLAALWQWDDIELLKETIATLQTKVGRVVVVGPVPRYDAPAATLIAKAMLRGRLDEMSKHVLPDAKALDVEMRAVIAPVATYVSPYEIICPQNVCRLFAAPDVPMQFDYHHLTPAGADQMMAAVRERFPHLFDAKPPGVSPPPGPAAHREVAPGRPERSEP